MSVITVEHLKKSYGSFVAVEDVSLDVKEGEIFGILGPNGAGKTTTVECLQGLRPYEGGDIRVLGFDPRHQARELRRVIGSQLQESALPERMKVWEALDLFAAVSPTAVDWETLLQQWGLKEKRGASFSSLSGGQRQRLFIALALVNRPKLVFLDEMTTGLDPAARRVAWDLVRAVRDGGATVVIVTHFMDEAEELCHRVAIIDRGRVIACDSPASLVAAHAGELSVTFTSADDCPWLGQVRCVTSVIRNGTRLEVKGSGALLAHVASSLLEHGIEPADLRVKQASLEDVFLKLTGKGSEDEA